MGSVKNTPGGLELLDAVTSAEQIAQGGFLFWVVRDRQNVDNGRFAVYADSLVQQISHSENSSGAGVHSRTVQYGIG